jgi:transcription elongation factor Elf1
MNYIDVKYIGLISNRLVRFKRKDDTTYIFRCPLCGDSQKNKSKTRGYIYQKAQDALFYCHNCHASMRFANLLRTVDPELYKEYVQERFVEQNNGERKDPPVDITKIARPSFMKDSPLKVLKKVSQLEWDHPAKQYINKRKIPPRFHHKLFYAPKFKTWINTIIPDKFDVSSGDEPRLIIPFLDKEKNCFGIQGRSFKKDGIRYITIMFDENKPKVYGLDDVDMNQLVYVVEGPIDSMFIPNCLAMAGSAASFLKNVPNFVLIMDNERRNKQIIEHIEKCIDLGYNICLWPDNVEHKDINDMVLAGMSEAEIKGIIDSNTYHGLQAKMKLVSWRRI